MTKTQRAEKREKQNPELDMYCVRIWCEVWADWSDQYPVGGGGQGTVGIITWHRLGHLTCAILINCLWWPTVALPLSYHRWWHGWRAAAAGPSRGTWTSRARHTGTAGSSPPSLSSCHVSRVTCHVSWLRSVSGGEEACPHQALVCHNVVISASLSATRHTVHSRALPN